MGKKKITELLGRASIRSTIYLYFTISALTALVFMGISFYGRLVGQMTAAIQEENQTMLTQVNHSVDSYLRTIMKLSDSLYYDVIKNADLSKGSIHNEMNLLYDNNRDCVSNIALFSKDGELIDTVPAARIKTSLDVTAEDWFTATLERTENLHFTTPHVQYIFDNDENQYTWVITLTRAVEITKGVSTEQGILLIDITYGSLKQLLDSIVMGNHGYLYMVSSGGQLIYHPQMQLIDAGQREENFQMAAGYRDGNYRESYQGKIRDVTVKSVGYTGWKLVGVTPERDSYLNTLKTKLFMVFLVALFLFMLLIANAAISSRITVPIRELEKSVNALESGNLDVEVYQGGSYEIRHLGRSIGEMARQIKVLMQDIVAEHESKRKSEFDTLQSQINPHFLYNTLNGIKWMAVINGNSAVADMLIKLGNNLRYSFDHKSTYITVEKELAFLKDYFALLQMRFGSGIIFLTDIPQELLYEPIPRFCIQPFIENAMSHGFEGMSEGEIILSAAQENDTLVFRVQDNGAGMEPEKAQALLQGQGESATSTGLGVWNVQQRIQLLYGPRFGLEIQSRPGQGCTVTIRLPMQNGLM